VMDFEFEKYKCRVLLRLVGTVEGFHWFRFTVRPVLIGSSSRTTIGSPKRGIERIHWIKKADSDWFLGLIDRFSVGNAPIGQFELAGNLNFGGKLLTSG